MKVISLCQQGAEAICIISANGVISNAKLRETASSEDTSTYEGLFEILTLCGSFILGSNEGASGGMSVSLATQDCRVISGGVAGLLIAASPVNVVVGRFLPA
ncbi:PPC domain [Sesbania bispinosa]|nr:PPC domain [Sesbania bispinosa]